MTKAERIKYKAAYYQKNKTTINRKSQDYVAAHKEEIVKYKADYYQKNKKEIATKLIAYREANQEKFIKRRTIYYKANRKKLLAKAAIYQKANKGKINIYRDANREKISAQRAIHRQAIKGEAAKYNTQHNKANALFDTYASQIDWIEPVRKSLENEKELQVKCALCGHWFNATNIQVRHRIEAINGAIDGDSNFYCSDDCKKACPVFNRTKYRRGDAPIKPNSRPGQTEWKRHVTVCAEYTCERCGKVIENGEAHHIKPVSQHPLESMDINNGVYLCRECHRAIHSEVGCRPIDLRCGA